MKWYGVVALVFQSVVWILLALVVGIWIYASMVDRCCFWRFRRRHRQPWVLRAAAGVDGSAGGSRGLQAAEIERYPKFSYPKVVEGVKMGGEVTDCVVCLGVFKESETLRLIPTCGHVFHSDCVDVWLRSSATCPCCRANLAAPPAEIVNELPV